MAGRGGGDPRSGGGKSAAPAGSGGGAAAARWEGKREGREGGREAGGGEGRRRSSASLGDGRVGGRTKGGLAPVQPGTDRVVGGGMAGGGGGGGAPGPGPPRRRQVGAPEPPATQWRARGRPPPRQLRHGGARWGGTGRTGRGGAGAAAARPPGAVRSQAAGVVLVVGGCECGCDTRVNDGAGGGRETRPQGWPSPHLLKDPSYGPVRAAEAVGRGGDTGCDGPPSRPRPLASAGGSCPRGCGVETGSSPSPCYSCRWASLAAPACGNPRNKRVKIAGKLPRNGTDSPLDHINQNLHHKESGTRL